jgi:hypothetical protein
MYEAVFGTAAVGLWLIRRGGNRTLTGEGKLLALLTVAGIVLGTYAFARLRSAGAPVDLVCGARPASS